MSDHFSRFIIKQTYDKLRTKPSNRRYTARERDDKGRYVLNPDIPIHDSETIPYGWEWYELGVIIHWTPPSSTTIICFDFPPRLPALIETALRASMAEIDFSDPYSPLLVIIRELLILYDNSVWSIRNHIANWEGVSLSIKHPALFFFPLISQARHSDPDYLLLHEIARHAIHVSETLTVAVRSIKDLEQQHQEFRNLHLRGTSPSLRNHSPFRLLLRIMEGLLSRSESNKARIQNETQLVRFRNFSERICVQCVTPLTQPTNRNSPKVLSFLFRPVHRRLSKVIRANLYSGISYCYAT